MIYFVRIWLSNGDDLHDKVFHFKKSFPEDTTEQEIDEYFQNTYQNLYNAFFSIYEPPKDGGNYCGWRYISQSEYEMLS